MTAARPLLRTAVAGLVLAGAALGGAPAAVAAPGDNGDVKIHSSSTSPLDQRNEPKVCSFYLAAFNFDGLQQVSYTITPQPMKTGDPSVQGAITLSPTGTGHTDELSLPDGMYKLTWTFTGATGAGKTKVFGVDCPDGTSGTSGTSEEVTPSGAVGAGGGGMAETPSDDGSSFGVAAALAAGLAGSAGLILVRRRRRADGAA
ncbi:hypothetical protein [Streptomyces sp. DH12]|uniref:hypothetical protein n=1 Tax=Streptomyces sp. DH12 TaxID=2857010 RepID=UPI001E2A5BDD|nr:hypothetical protein [Streptomyces sp. DH12]